VGVCSVATRRSELARTACRVLLGTHTAQFTPLPEDARWKTHFAVPRGGLDFSMVFHARGQKVTLWTRKVFSSFAILRTAQWQKSLSRNAKPLGVPRAKGEMQAGRWMLRAPHNFRRSRDFCGPMSPPTRASAKLAFFSAQRSMARGRKMNRPTRNS